MNTLALPPLYRRWVDDILKQEIRPEPRATCDDCVMCTYVHPPAKQDRYFNPNVKCCSYQPAIPNFLIGGVIADDDPSLSEVKQQFLSRVIRALITPYGISPTYLTALFHTFKAFGQYEQLLCPYYLNHSGGRCGIWKYRNGLCSTYFCKHERGAVGWRFWRQLSAMLYIAEKTLAQYCVNQLPVIIPENASDIREKTWGNWTFREAEYYQSCWDIVRPLQWEEVLKIGGTELEASVEELKNRRTALQTTVLPEALKINFRFRYEEVSEGLSRVWSYSSYNPIDLPTNVVQALEYFDGRPVSEVLIQLQKEKDLSIDNDLLIKLTDYEILLPAN